MIAALPDWSRPWLQPYAAQGQRLQAALCAGQPLHMALNAGATADQPRFVPQHALPAGQGYEAHLHARRECPTRDNLHDLLNGLAWLHFPRSKWRLNALHAAELARLGAGPRRGPLRDAMTLFDENGALLLAPRGMWDALRARDWHGLFVAQRERWHAARVLVFGHGLLEQLQTPRKPLTAHVLAAPIALETIADIDRWLADSINADVWRAKPFAPLPVLGVPGWCAQNAHESFYDDRFVFRPAARSDIREQRTLARVA